jgi:RNA polymerase sigma-70 factor, ECF subfamily
MPATATQADFEIYRRELTGYCYRMLGSAFEADDAVQETMLRAWKNAESFEGRSSLRSWLYKIATNVCLDALRGEKRRALPMDLGPSSPPLETLLRPWPTEDVWVTPIPDVKVMPEHGDPAEIAAMRESVRLAFVTALRFWLIALSGRVVSHARKLIIRLGAGAEALAMIVTARQTIRALRCGPAG